MDRLRLPAPAKINLFLNIVGRRNDGYHELQTVFQLLDFCDELQFEPRDDIVVECEQLPKDIDNLVSRAAEALKALAGHDGGALIRLEKHIPIGAGLGGGSSDAATTLLGLSQLWNLEIDHSELMALGASLGADVPVFLAGRSAWAEGIGEVLQPIDLPEKWFVIINPGCSVSTAEIFNHPDLTRNGSPITIARFLRQGSANVCEPLVRQLYREVDEALRWLGKWGTARMTGTGSCVFLEFETEEQAKEVAADVPARWTSVVAAARNLSPLHEALQ
jgi:4-diphosphocytidyl-2-C-methyl-D-erythritol kinase